MMNRALATMTLGICLLGLAGTGRADKLDTIDVECSFAFWGQGGGTTLNSIRTKAR